jgi:FkbM family methyltransferase
MLLNILKGVLKNNGKMVQLDEVERSISTAFETRVIDGFVEIGAHIAAKPATFWMSLQGQRDQVAVEALKKGWTSYEAPLPQLIATWSSNLPLVFADIGANSGYYSLLSAAFGARNVIAFEPANDIANLLDTNIKRSNLDQKIHVKRLAISSNSGTFKIYYPDASHGLIETSASLNPSFRSTHHKTANVTVETLDNALNGITTINEKLLLKIEVEGHDFEVLEGATRIIAAHRPGIIIELLPGVELSPFNNFLKNNKYVHYTLSSNGYLKKEPLTAENVTWPQRDHLLLPKETADFWLQALQTPESAREQAVFEDNNNLLLPVTEPRPPRIIFFLAPFTVPFGGVAVIFMHVATLNRNGIAAWVALPELPDVNFYEWNVPKIIYGETFGVSDTDICVFPEGLLGYTNTLRGTPAKRIMFCQNQYYLPFSSRPERGFSEFQLDSVVVSSLTIKACLEDLYGLTDIPVIPCAVDASKYTRVPNKARQIAFMPRKLGNDAKFIHAAFVRMYPNYSDVSWVAISQMTRRDAAKVLSESAIFLSLSDKESFGLPPLEAMASGCVVAGFHGDGGREYMNEGNGWWAETGDWRACVHGLASALETFDKGGEGLEGYHRRAMQTVEAYSVEIMEEKLLAFWRHELALIAQ